MLRRVLVTRCSQTRLCSSSSVGSTAYFSTAPPDAERWTGTRSTARRRWPGPLGNRPMGPTPRRLSVLRLSSAMARSKGPMPASSIMRFLGSEETKELVQVGVTEQLQKYFRAPTFRSPPGQGRDVTAFHRSAGAKTVPQEGELVDETGVVPPVRARQDRGQEQILAQRVGGRVQGVRGLVVGEEGDRGPGQRRLVQTVPLEQVDRGQRGRIAPAERAHLKGSGFRPVPQHRRIGA